MDKQLRLAKISKLIYRLTFKPKLYKLDLSKKFKFIEKRNKKMMRKLVHENDALFCLPKNEVVINKSVKKEGELVLPTQLVDHFIDKSGYRAIMKYCVCRDANNCKDYPTEVGCIFLGEAAKKIHPDMARPATKEEAKAHLKKCREKGLVHLAGKAYLDTVWLDIQPHDKLFTICSCCPCCCISLAVPYVAPSLVDWFHKLPGVDVEVLDSCAGCETCISSCVYGGIEMDGGHARTTEECKACGRCIEACPNDAIRLNIKDMHYVEQAIDRLSSTVDVS